MILNSPTISGSLTVTGNTILSGSLAVNTDITGSNLRATGTTTTPNISWNGTIASNGGEIRINQTQFRNGAPNTIVWAGTTDSNAARDLGLRRNATGSLEIYDGNTAGTYRDLILRNITGSNATFSGSVTIVNTLTAQTLVVQTITSSVDFVTGSARFGSNTGNTHQFTGSVLVSGSISSFMNNVGVGTATPVGGGGASDRTLSINAATGAATFLTGLINGTRYSTLFTAANSVVLETNAAIPLVFNTNSTERMRIDASGNVGIGMTANIDQKLTVNGRIRVSPDGNNGGDMAVNDGGLAFSSIGASPIEFFTSNYANERMRITSGGSVGINTTTPTATLDVAGSGKFRSGYMIYGGSAYSSYTANGLWGATATPNFVGTNGQGSTYNKFSGVNGGLILGYQDNGNGLYSPAYGFEVKSTDGRPVAGIVVKALVMKDVDTNGEPMVIYNNGSSYWENSMEVAKTSGTYSQLRLTSDATYASVVRDYILTTASNLDIATERTDGGAFNFLLLVSSTLVASASHRNYYTFAVQGRGTTATATQLSNVSAGTASRAAVSVSFPSNGIIRLNLTGGESCQLKVTAIGHGAL